MIDKHFELETKPVEPHLKVETSKFKSILKGLKKNLKVTILIAYLVFAALYTAYDILVTIFNIALKWI